MNPHDQANLQFLLNADTAVMQDWFSKTDHEDHVYAQELLAAHAADLRAQSMDLRIEAELIAMNNQYTQAVTVINNLI